MILIIMEMLFIVFAIDYVIIGSVFIEIKPEALFACLRSNKTRYTIGTYSTDDISFVYI